MFRVAHRAPFRLKRPLGFADSLTSLQRAVRIYAIVDSSGGSLRVCRSSSPDIDLVDMFSSQAAATQRMLGAEAMARGAYSGTATVIRRGHHPWSATGQHSFGFKDLFGCSGIVLTLNLFRPRGEGEMT